MNTDKRFTFKAGLIDAALTTTLATVLAAALGFSSAQAQTVLKFSHTDQPGGARNAAALLFAKSVESYTQGRY